MSDTWTSDGVLVERWVSSTTPGYSFNVVIREGDIVVEGGGSGDVVGPASVTADRPAVFDGTTGKLLKQGSATGAALASAADAAAARTALGLGTAATAATGDFTTPAQVDTQIESYYLPFNATLRVHNPVANYGGTVGSGTATIAAFSGIPAGRTLWLEGQTNSADDGFYLAEGAGVFTLSEVQPLSSAVYVGREIVVGVDLEYGGAPTLWVATSDGSTISATRTSVRPDQLTATLASYALAADLDDYLPVADFLSGLLPYVGTGLLAGIAPFVDQALNGLEGIVDRWQFVSAYSTTNVDLSTLVGVEAEVVSQPTLSDGTVPVRDSDVRLFGQTNPAENGAYLVSNDGMEFPGTWVKYVNPDIFDPPGNGYRVTCNAPGTDGHGVTFLWIDDDRGKSRRVGSSDLSEASASGEWVRLATPSTDLTAAPSAPLVVGGQDEGPTVTATSATTLLDAPIALTNDTSGDHYTVSFGGTWLNNSGTTKTFTITVLIGSTTVATLAPVSAISSSASVRYFRGVVDIRVNGASDLNVIADGQVGTSFFPVSGGAAAENIGAGVNLDVRGAVQSGGSQELQLTQVTVARART